MKQTTKMSRAVSQLEHIYNSLNSDFFDEELPTPIITVQSKPGTYGHCSVAKVWQRKNDKTYEMNISAETLNYPIEEVIDTLLHEMCHLYCRENNIKEVSRGGKYHNKRFKEVAETHGLTCVPCGQYGWNTTPGDNLVEYALTKGWNEILLGRNTLPPAMRTGATGTAHPEQRPLEASGPAPPARLYARFAVSPSGPPKRSISFAGFAWCRWLKLDRLNLNVHIQ